MNLEPGACLSLLADHKLLPADRCAVYITGSLIRGWDNAKSDVDVYIVSATPWQGDVTVSASVSVAPGLVPITVFDTGDRRWEVEYWFDGQVDELLALVSHEALESGESRVDVPCPTEITFINRLKFAHTLEGDDWLRRCREQFDATAIRTIVAGRALHSLDRLTEDAVGMLENDDLSSAVLAGHLALGYAVDALLANRGDLENQAKWRARRIKEAELPELPFEEYWKIESMATYDDASPGTWVRETLRVCQRLASAVEL